MPASTRTGAGTTTPAAGSYWTGSATTATSRTGAWASTSPAHPKSKATASFPPPTPYGTRRTKYLIECKYRKEVTGYAGDVVMTIAGGHPGIQMGTKWIGTEGWVWVDRGGFDASNPDWIKGDSLPEDLRKVKLYESHSTSATSSTA